jgi:hypothetical protein
LLEQEEIEAIITNEINNLSTFIVPFILFNFKKYFNKIF